MDFAKLWLPLSLSVVLAGCNTESSNDSDDDTGSPSSELALAKAFVQDFAGLQNSLMELEVPVSVFAEQIDDDLRTVDDADAEAFARAFEVVMYQLDNTLETMITDDGTGYRIEFNTIENAPFIVDTDPGVTFSDASSFSFTDAGQITASGEATVDVDGTDESVAFDLDFNLPEINDQDTGSVTYVLSASINFTTDTLILDATNAGGTLKLALGDKTVAELSESETGPQGSELTSLEIGIDALSLEMGGLRFDGASTLTINEFSLSETVSSESLEVGFSIVSQGRLTASDASYFDASMSLSGNVDDSYTETDSSYSDSWEVGLSYSFTTTFKTSEHDFDVTAEGTIISSANFGEDWSDDTWTDEGMMSTEGGVTITHNGATFKIDYDFSQTFSDIDSEEQIDLVIQDASVTTDTVIIVLGDFDDIDTDAYEFGQVKVNGTRYGTLLNDEGTTKAKFTDGSSVVVFNSL